MKASAFLVRRWIDQYLDDADDTFSDTEFLEIHGVTLEQSKKVLEDFAIYVEHAS